MAELRCMFRGDCFSSVVTAEIPRGLQDQSMAQLRGESSSIAVKYSSALSHDDGDVALHSKHRIFLSHSGSQKDFVEQLCVDLERCDRHPFFDRRRESLPIGENFPQHILGAIRQCHVGVVILSEEFFTRSKWPMIELAAMVEEAKQRSWSFRILPVFLGIRPDQFHNETKRDKWLSCWKEFALKDERVAVEQWRDALNFLRSINGLVYDGLGEVKFRRVIVEVLCKVVRAETRLEDSHIQGRSRMCELIRNEINAQATGNNRKVRVVGLYGMAGVGKTSICKALCNEFSSEFHGRVCHAELERGSREELMREVLKRVTDASHELISGWREDELLNRLNGGIMKEAVFLAVDNVSDTQASVDEARRYVGASLPAGSVVVVTARGRGTLMRVRPYVTESNVLEMPELDVEEAKSLFAASSNLECRSEADEELVVRCVERCHFAKGDGSGRKQYHPLMLDVLGKQLGCVDRREWKAELNKIDEDIFNRSGEAEHPMFSILRKTYDTLSREDQLLFVDAALDLRPQFEELTVLGDGDEGYGLDLLEWLGTVHGISADGVMRRLERLERKSLLERLGGGREVQIGMHDLWRAFCKAEVECGGLRDRRWVYGAEGSELVNTNPLSITPNSSLSSEGSLGSDGEDDDPVVGGAAPSVFSTKRKMSYPALDDGQGAKFPRTQTVQKGKGGSSKKFREPRYSIQTRGAVDIMEDGYTWRKYAQIGPKDSPHCRSYYRCTTPNCPVRKWVRRARDDPRLMTTTYEGVHSHLCLAAASSNASFIQDMCNTYIKCGKFEGLCNAEGIHEERLIEIGRGRLTAALFPEAFRCHLRTLAMSSKSSKADPPFLLQEAANLVVKDLPYATKEPQVGESRSFQFYDEVDNGDPVDVDDVFSLGGLIAVCQKFPHGEPKNLEDLGTNHSTEYCIVQHDLTGAYLCRRVLIQVLEDQLVGNAVGVLGVEVTGEDIHVENIRDDGSYYSGTLKDFSYPFVLNNNGNSEAMEKQCATRLFGHVKGAEFLAGKEYGLKCSPLLAIALTIATQKKRTLALKWTRTHGHIEIDGLEHFMEFGKMKWEVLYTDKINQLGWDVEWGMEQVQRPYEMTNSQTSGTSNLQALASVFGNGVQQKRSVGIQLSLPGGVGIGGSIEMYGSKGKELAKEVHPQIMEQLRREASKFVETSDLYAEHARVKDDLLQGRLPDAQYNYLVVWDDADNGHVSVYWAMDDGKLKWITDILLPCGKRDHEKLFKGGLRGLRMRVKRDGSKLVSTNAHKPASDLISRFKKHKQLDIDSSMTQVPPGLQSKDEWVHLIGPQTKYSGNKFLWEASFMRAIISSRTSYLSGVMLDTFVLKDKLGEIGHCEKNKLDEIGQCNYASRLVHHTDRVAAWGQFSKAPTSLVQGTNLIKWGGLVDENDLC